MKWKLKDEGRNLYGKRKDKRKNEKPKNNLKEWMTVKERNLKERKFERMKESWKEKVS